MSRRYSDQPINLIARIPSPEQMSAARPKQRSFSQLVVESGATCVRGMAEMVAQLRRLGRSAGSSMGGSAGGASLGRAGEPVPGVIRSVTETVSQSYERSTKGIAEPDATVTPAHSAQRDLESMCGQTSRPMAPAVESTPHDEVIALRSELSAQQQEVARLSAQLQELKSLVGSQQQVLVYLGQELEAQQAPIMSAAAQAAPSVKKTRVVRAKPASKAQPALRNASREPSLNI
jgi:hypothetical protein